jgi:hypothetical protein
VSTTPRTPLPYRHHTHLPEWVCPTTTDESGSVWGSTDTADLFYRGTRNTASSAARALATEWPLVNTAHRSDVQAWALTDPALAGFTSGGAILDAIDDASNARQDQLLLALLRLSQTGERFATRTLLQAMMPKLSQLAHYADTDGDIKGSDRSSITVSAFLTVVHTYPVQRRPRSVAGNLALDTLHHIAANRRTPTTTPTRVLNWDPWQLEYAAAAEGIGSLNQTPLTTDTTADADPGDEVRQLLTWALEHEVITTDEAALLRRSFLTDPTDTTPRGHSAAAEELGLSPAAVRQRCSRAIRRIRTAVHEQLGSDDLLDAMTVAA